MDYEKLKDLNFISGVVKYSELFPQDADEAKEIYRRLAQAWHPDKHPFETKDKASTLFLKITNLYEEAKNRIETGTYGYGKSLMLHFGGKAFRYIYFGEDEVDSFGAQYTGRTTVCMDFSDAIHPYLETWKTSYRKFEALAGTYPSFTKDFQHQLAAKPVVEKSDDGCGYVIRVNKTPSHLCLAHVLRQGPLAPEHATWIISRLLSLARFCTEADVVNLDICPRNIFIHPAEHSLIVIDGWQYAAGFHTRPLAAPQRFLRLVPMFANTPVFLQKYYTVQIKAIGRTCLGDSIGTRLLNDKKIPKPLAKWVNSAYKTTLGEEMVEWKKVKKESFGDPKFIKLILDEKDLYS